MGVRMTASDHTVPRSESASTAKKVDLLITGAAQVLTCVAVPDNPVGRIDGGAVAIAGGRIVAVGPSSAVAHDIDCSKARVIDASGRIVAPGFVDCHTHLVFGGSRAREYGLRMTHTVQEVKKTGLQTGILATVTMTRAASVDDLTQSAAERLGRMLRAGTTTVESKSGYGLTVSEELKMLEVNRRLCDIQPVDIVSTFLGAHEFPREMSREDYVELVINEMIPTVREHGLARFCDVYCDDGYYTTAESRRILEAGEAAGLRAKIHTDAYSNIGGADMSADIGVISADHLNCTSRESMRRLAVADVVGVLMPALDFAVRHPRPFDARTMIAEGMTVALATDICPACWAESMQFVMQLACRLYSFSPEEALLASTWGAAKAVGLENDRGTLEVGKRADIQMWDVPGLDDVIYRLGNNAVETVIVEGEIVHSENAMLLQS